MKKKEKKVKVLLCIISISAKSEKVYNSVFKLLVWKSFSSWLTPLWNKSILYFLLPFVLLYFLYNFNALFYKASRLNDDSWNRVRLQFSTFVAFILIWLFARVRHDSRLSNRVSKQWARAMWKWKTICENLCYNKKKRRQK